MVELSSGYLEQQNQLLREIRDAISSSRAPSAGFASGPSGGMTHGDSLHGGRGGAYVQAQTTYDRMLAGEWASFGWTNAYKSVMKTSLTTDIAAALGLARAPNTLTQFDYENLAFESLGVRATSAVGSLFAPKFVARTNALAEDIFANSARFVRFGDPAASTLGAGFTFGTANQLARQIQLSAVGDMRMTGADISTVASVGMRTGQFDGVRSTDEFMTRLKTMSSAVADLTRTLHMSVSEIAQSMGNLRMFGVRDPSDQRRMMMQMGAGAMVAGMTGGEMMTLAGATAANGMGMGLSATTTMPLAINTAATLRALSTAGVVSQNIMAQGGGVQQIQQSIDNARMGFAASTSGYLAAVGGGTDFFSGMMRGLDASGGSLNGILGLQANRLDRLSGMSAGQLERGYDNMLRTRLKLLGINDSESPEATNAVFAMTRHQMGDAAALAFSRGHFSSAGRAVAERTRMLEMDAGEMQERKLDYDQYWLNNSFRGRMQSASRFISGVPSRILGSVLNAVDPGQSGGIFGRGKYAADSSAILLGASPDRVRMSDLVSAMRVAGPEEEENSIEFSPTGYAANTLGIVGTVGGALAGAKAGALIGGMVGGPLGLGVGLLAGGVLGAVGAHLGGEGMAAVGTLFDGSPRKLSGAAAQQYSRVLRATTNGGGGLRARELLASGSLANNSVFMELARNTNRTGLGVDQSIDFANQVNRVAAMTGESADTIVAALKASGVSIEMENATKSIDPEKFNASINKLLGGVSGDTNFALGENAAAMQDYLSALTSGDSKKLLAAQTALASSGVNGTSIASIKQNFLRMGGKDRNELMFQLTSFRSKGASAEINRRLGTASRYAASILEGAKEDGVSGAGSAIKALEGTGEDRRKLLELLNPENAEGASMRKILSANSGVFRGLIDVMGTSSEDLQRMSAEDASRRFTGISSETFNTMRKQFKGDDFKHALEMLMLDKNNLEKTGEYDKQSSDAEVMSKTVIALDGIINKLGLTAAPAGAKK